MTALSFSGYLPRFPFLIIMMSLFLQFCITMVLPALLLAAGFSHLASPPDGMLSTVYTHGENGFQCIRIPGTLGVPSSRGDTVLLSFAAARSFAGDSCFPNAKTPNPKQYSAHVVKRSTDLGKTWGAMVELGRNSPSGDQISPEGCELYHAKSKTCGRSSLLPSSLSLSLSLPRSLLPPPTHLS